MVSVKVAAIAAGVSLLPTLASAADMPSLLPPVELPVVEDFGSGWYLRGDLGMSNQNFKNLHQRLYDVPGTNVEGVGMGFDGASFFGLGVGYQFNDWMRFDVTGEYRSKSNFHGSDNISFPGGANVDNYSGSKSEWVVLANAYVDLGTWYRLTPYIGAGVGGAYNKITGFRDDGVNYAGGVQSSSTTYAEDNGKFNFAWALYAGLSYKVTPTVSLELGYRYLNLGGAQTGATRAFDGSFTNGGPFSFNNIYSHDFKIGVRWLLDAPLAPQQINLPPLMSRG
jgi:opacity protein-like surface antigen